MQSHGLNPFASSPKDICEQFHLDPNTRYQGFNIIVDPFYFVKHILRVAKVTKKFSKHSNSSYLYLIKRLSLFPFLFCNKFPMSLNSYSFSTLLITILWPYLAFKFGFCKLWIYLFLCRPRSKS